MTGLARVLRRKVPSLLPGPRLYLRSIQI